MKIGVLGTGSVGSAIASKLVSLGHDVEMGSRSASNDKALAWVASAGSRASAGTFADAAAFGEVVFNCTNGNATLEAVRAAGADAIGDKVLVDLANRLPLPPERGISLGEAVQQAVPRARVVKALNTVNAQVMVEPARLPGSHAVLICGNDAEAKRVVRGLLESFGWREIVDLGDIKAARATEGFMDLWLALAKSLGTYVFNVQIVR
jgi:8-hydroxy-5-deazaflavin:NADPH oxidoreductase